MWGSSSVAARPAASQQESITKESITYTKEALVADSKEVCRIDEVVARPE
jgi:hypothetical protein